MPNPNTESDGSQPTTLTSPILPTSVWRQRDSVGLGKVSLGWRAFPSTTSTPVLCFHAERVVQLTTKGRSQNDEGRRLGLDGRLLIVRGLFSRWSCCYQRTEPFRQLALDVIWLARLPRITVQYGARRSSNRYVIGYWADKRGAEGKQRNRECMCGWLPLSNPRFGESNCHDENNVELGRMTSHVHPCKFSDVKLTTPWRLRICASRTWPRRSCAMA